MEIRPFAVDVPPAILDELPERLGGTRWPDEVAAAGWDYRADLGYMRRLVQHWRTFLDWRAQEPAMNVWPHFALRWTAPASI